MPRRAPQSGAVDLTGRVGAGDFKVTVHRNPEVGWHATIYGRQSAEVHRCQLMADTIVTELSQYYELDTE